MDKPKPNQTKDQKDSKPAAKTAVPAIPAWPAAPVKVAPMFRPTDWLPLAITFGVSFSVAAAKFSRKCPTEDVPGMSNTFGARWSSHARATCIGVTPRRAAISPCR